MQEYLNWNEKTIFDFSPKKITTLYNEGYVFTRKSKGVMQQTRSLRIDLDKFELSSENRRVLRKIEGLDLNIVSIPCSNYSWEIGKLAKDFYDTKFGPGTMSANKVKELMTSESKSNFNSLFAYFYMKKIVGYAICYVNDKIIHYSYPFYNLKPNHLIPNLGLGMMLMAISAVKENNKKHIYLGSAQRPTDTYKLQFKGLEWFDGNRWTDDLDKLKSLLI
jgi:leucyl-tRNA---protein transferase